MAASRYLLVRVGSRRLLIPTAAIRRVVRGLSVLPVPGTGPGFAGLAQNEGEPLPVVDLAVVVGAGEATGSLARLVVVVDLPGDVAGAHVALAVDETIAVTGPPDEGEPGVELLDLARVAGDRSRSSDL